MNNVIIKPRALDNIAQYIDITKKSLIVTDDGVPSVHVDKLQKQLINSCIVTIEHGEHHKTISSYQAVMRKLMDENFDRHDQIIALGGGIVCDLTGFVASTFKRGVDFINIPTTSLAMIDASVGGKTAINFNGVKNVIGTFYDAKAVIIDSTVLETLPKRHLYNGLVEALKMGLCLDRELYEIFLKNDYLNKIDIIIEKSVSSKLKIVEKDPKENNLRKVLNFGHTIGHAIEAANLDKIYHGEAVGIGMLFAIKNKELKEQVKKILLGMGINCGEFPIKPKELIEYILNDKKKNNEKIDFIILEDVEKFTIVPLSLEEITALIEGE